MSADISAEKMVAFALSKLRALPRSSSTGADILAFCEKFQSRFYSILKREAFHGRSIDDLRHLGLRFYNEVDLLFCSCFNVRAFLASEEENQQARLEEARRSFEEARARRIAVDSRIADFDKLVTRASMFEKEGDLASAASTYEAGLAHCVSSGLGIGHRRRCWERLYIVYRKLGRLSDEASMLVDAIGQLAAKGSPLSLINRYEERLKRCHVLLAKSQTPGF